MFFNTAAIIQDPKTKVEQGVEYYAYVIIELKNADLYDMNYLTKDNIEIIGGGKALNVIDGDGVLMAFSNYLKNTLRTTISVSG